MTFNALSFNPSKTLGSFSSLVLKHLDFLWTDVSNIDPAMLCHLTHFIITFSHLSHVIFPCLLTCNLQFKLFVIHVHRIACLSPFSFSSRFFSMEQNVDVNGWKNYSILVNTCIHSRYCLTQNEFTKCIQACNDINVN